MKQQIQDIMNQIERLGLTENDFKRILSRLSDTELALVEQLTRLHRLAESELRRLLVIVEKLHLQLQECASRPPLRPAV